MIGYLQPSQMLRPMTFNPPPPSPLHLLLLFPLEMGLPSPNICPRLFPTRRGETNSTYSGSVPSGESGKTPWPRFEIPAVPFTSSESQSVIFMSYWVQIWLPCVFFARQMCEAGWSRQKHTRARREIGLF